ncbi:bile acid:sodium symporter family protein [Leptospira gomenensis]|uniref:Bile acid:sodium symporter family protein n=1 Tax=Leptospira gomenensis TaxID=2484974 RepID=A0A5F1YDV7_9LEPT|nr:bile acid:sodium symporter family protein [Leptospira gomenensis]TGK36380.1 bile acid:sodium symporter family protein [Leptospira gomenensis]TGK42031.1 bile acid:sodium symporter family protein [Leptospira gomenensis]TGK48886.1 bile acid:sodium symporter family protein [Leptospira gomenensis]TGK58015.1 bile acid:sodium symporter family protein [Leptospira gomenensis]
MTELDSIRINFSESGLVFLNILLGFIMFGIALELKPKDFRLLFEKPRASLTGIVSQFFLFPLITYLLLRILQPPAGVALGMLLVAACPGGNISNFITMMAKGNTALSISLTAFSSSLAIVATPFNFFFWGSLYPPVQTALREISLDPFDVFKAILVILLIPISLGLATKRFSPNFAVKIEKPIKILSALIFTAFLVVALAANFSVFLRVIHKVFLYVFLMNAAGFSLGYFFAKAMRLDEKDARCISIETGIQNSGLGLVLIFAFFNGQGSMAIIAAVWGIWHAIAGALLAWFWSKRTANLTPQT